MDNRIFNINGKTRKQLELAVDLLLLDEYGEKQKVRGWYFSQNKGLVLTWFVGPNYNAQPFTDRMGNVLPIDEPELVNILWEWLKSDESKTVKPSSWEGHFEDSDVDNELGWRLYVEDWGHINADGGGTDHYSVAAFKPAYLWYGK